MAVATAGLAAVLADLLGVDLAAVGAGAAAEGAADVGVGDVIAARLGMRGAAEAAGGEEGLAALRPRVIIGRARQRLELERTNLHAYREESGIRAHLAHARHDIERTPENVKRALRQHIPPPAPNDRGPLGLGILPEAQRRIRGD